MDNKSLSFKGKENYINNRKLSANTSNGKQSLISIDSQHNLSTVGLRSFDNQFLNYIQFKVKQYELHPFRRPNLKIINEDVKYKLFEMNKKTTFENDNFVSLSLNQSSFGLKKDKDIINNEKKEGKLEEKKEVKKEEKHEKGNNNNQDKNYTRRNNIFRDVIKKERIMEKQRKKNKNKKYLKLLNNRKLKRARNLYDSNDDDESENENEDFYVINPETNIIIAFDLLKIIFFLYYFIVTTIYLCQDNCFCKLNNKINLSDVLLVINDLLFITDLILSFFRAYYNFEYKLIKSKSLISKNYLQNGFFLDLLSSIPILSVNKYICLKDKNYSYCFRYEMPGIFIFLKLCSLLKTLKLRIIFKKQNKNQAIEKFIDLFSENYHIEKYIKIIIYSLVYIAILHCFVCIHIFLGNNSYSNWLIQTKTGDESFPHIYIKSIYFMITTLTTVGYGDIVSQSMIERIFQIIILVLGSIFYPFIVSSVGNIVKKDSNAKIKLANNFSMLEKFRKDYPNITFNLYNNIHNYFEKKNHSIEKYDINSFIGNLPFSLKNNILFTMYQTYILNFKFFKNNNNSVFIAEVLSNFIPSISKKNEFLIYEGEMLEEIIFIKDGKLAFNAAVNIEDPSTSINKYFLDKFAPFTNEAEKKLILENINNKSNFSFIGDITYDRAKNKLNNAVKTVTNRLIFDDKNQFQINSNLNEKNVNNEFDPQEGTINNEEGNYHYLKIVDIRKNEHFGCVFMTMKKPCPLSLQVKSKIVELFLLKKDKALNVSRNYPNIWRKLYSKEFHNLIAIKKKTFTILKKYIGKNELLMDNHIKDMMTTNSIPVNNLNFCKISSLNKKSSKKWEYSEIKENVIRNNSLNYHYDRKNNKISALRENTKMKVRKKIELKGSHFLPHQKFRVSNSSQTHNINYCPTPQFKTDNNNKINCFSGYSNSKNIEISNQNNSKHKQKSKREKLKNLKSFLINSKNYFTNGYEVKKNISFKENDNNNNHLTKKCSTKKNILKNKSSYDNIFNKINSKKENDNQDDTNIKKTEFDSNLNKEKNNKNENSERILKDLKDICDKETNFSFCSINKENNYNIDSLSIDNNSSFEILSSYSNINKISKGKYIKDIYFQKKLKLLIKNHYLDNANEYNFNNSLSTRTIVSSKGEEKSNNKINSQFKNKKLSNNKKLKNEKKSDKYKSHNTLGKLDRYKNSQEFFNEKIYKTDFYKKKNLISKNKTTNNKNEYRNTFGCFSTFKKQNEILSNSPINDLLYSNSIKEDKNKISTNSIESDSDKQNNSLNINIKKNVKFHNNDEVEFIIDENIKKNIRDDNILIKNNYYENNNKNKLYKNKKKNYYNNKESIYEDEDKSNQLINQTLGIKIANNNIISNNILTTSSKINEHKENINSIEKIKNLDSAVNIYNIIHKNINKNLNIIDNKEQINVTKSSTTFCCIY